MIRKLNLFLAAATGILLSLPWMLPEMGGVLFWALVPLLIAEERVSRNPNDKNNQFRFGLAFFAFLIWNVCATWWIAYVSLVGMLLIVALNSLLMASVWWLRHPIRRQFGERAGFFSLLVFWLSFEFFHHNWTIQWPWLTLGNGFAHTITFIQWYEFTGVLGGSLWILSINILFFLFFTSLSGKQSFQTVKLGGYLFVLVALPLCWSIYRYSSYEEKGATQRVVILQPNIDPYTQKFSVLTPENQLLKLVSLADSIVSDSTDLILAPETALPLMWEDSIHVQSLDPIFKLLQRYSRAKFIGGAMTQRKFGKDETISQTARISDAGDYFFDVFNSALMFDRSPKVQIAHKNKLVSGVEKMPFQEYLAFVSKYLLRLGGTGGSLGASKESVLFVGEDSVKIGPVICFESAFAEYVSTLVRKGATVLVVITNDGWWKDSPGSWQHFGYSRLRAVENRRSITRSANTGISGFINQRGEVVIKTSLNRSQTLNASIRLNNEMTFYTRYGDYLGRLSAFLSALIVLYWFVNRFRGK